MTLKSIVIVGGGQAAGCAAAALRKAGYDGGLTIIGEEPQLPYERPPLSKEFLQGGYDMASAAVHPEGYYRDNDITVMTGIRVTAIDCGRRKVETNTGKTLAFDRLLIATGCRARLFPGSAIAGDSAVYLRTLSDAERIAVRLAPGRKVLLVGGGFIGLEIAATARSRGCDVTVLEASGALLSRVLPAAAARFLEDLHRGQGVEIKTGAQIETVTDMGDRSVAHCRDGRSFEADLIVIGIGAIPNQDLAMAAGLAVEDGVLVDDKAQTKSSAIFAAGDVTRHPNAFYGRLLRLETWDNARKQAELAARNMLGGGDAYDEIPWMWTDQFGRNVQMLGLPEANAEVVLRGRPDDGSFAVFTCANGRIRSAVLVNQGRERRPVTRLMRCGHPLRKELLANTSVPLKQLAEAART